MTFNPNRFILLIKKEMILEQKNILIRIAAFGGVAFMLAMFSTAVGESGEALMTLFLALLWLGGFIYTSIAFKDAHSARTVHDWLMTPASRSEKFLYKLLLTTVVYIIIVTAGVFIGSLLNVIVYALFFSASPELFNPFQDWAGQNMLHYVITQSVFFLGAVWFRKHNFLKTVLATNVIYFAMVLILGGIGALSFLGPLRDANRGDALFFMEAGEYLMNFFHSLSPWIFKVMKIIYYALLAPFFWFLAWLRMKEIEVTDGI